MDLDDFRQFCGPALGDALRPELFKALGDPVRLALVARLAVAEEPLTVTAASSCCGVHLSGISRHLKQLERAGVLCVEKRGREVLYELDRRHLAFALRGLADAIERGASKDCCPEKQETRDEQD